MATTLALPVATRRQLSILMSDEGFCRSRLQQEIKGVINELWNITTWISGVGSCGRKLCAYGLIGTSLSSSFIPAGKKHLDNAKVYTECLLLTCIYILNNNNVYACSVYTAVARFSSVHITILNRAEACWPSCSNRASLARFSSVRARFSCIQT